MLWLELSVKKWFGWKQISAYLAVVISLLLVLYWNNIQRLHTAITLYDEDKIVGNFLGLYKSFNHTVLEPSSRPFIFPYAKTPLPSDFPLGEEILSLPDFLKDSGTTGLIVIKNGHIKYEEYFQGHGEAKQHISWSVAKSFVSGLFGIAIDEGHIKSIEDKVTDYVPELAGSGYDNVRIKDVLQMSSGVEFNEDYGDFHSDINRFSRAIAFGSSLDDFAASLIRDKEPGAYNHYVSIDTQVLGMILTRATKQPLTQYLQDKIWQPLGMEHGAYWLADDDKMELALGGLMVSLRDYAKFGWLYLKQGQWQGKQIVPRQWVIDSVTPDAAHVMPGQNNPQSSNSFGYGYQWWVPLGAEDEFAAQGIYHQYIYIDPDQNLVIVKHSANHKYNDRRHNWSAKHYAMFRAISEYFED